MHCNMQKVRRTSNKEHRVLIPERVDVRDVRQRLNNQE